MFSVKSINLNNNFYNFTGTKFSQNYSDSQYIKSSLANQSHSRVKDQIDKEFISGFRGASKLNRHTVSKSKRELEECFEINDQTLRKVRAQT
jgi:hypothetical protein